MQPKYPNVMVRLTGEDGNAFFILGKCIKEARRIGLTEQQIGEFREKAVNGDYNNLLQTCMEYFDVS